MNYEGLLHHIININSTTHRIEISLVRSRALERTKVPYYELEAI